MYKQYFDKTSEYIDSIFHVAVTKEQVIDQLNRKFKDNPQKVDEIINADPTPNKGYSIWIGKLLLSNSIILPEDTDKIIETLTSFEELKKRRKIKGVDINQLNSFYDLVIKVEEAQGVKTKGEQYQESLEKGQELIYNNAEFKVVKITTPEASVKLAKNTQWCVKDNRIAEHYLKKSPLIMIFKADKPYVLLHEATGQAKDVYDRAITRIIAMEISNIWDYLQINDFKGELDLIIENISNEKLYETREKLPYKAFNKNLISEEEFIDFATKAGHNEDLAAWFFHKEDYIVNKGVARKPEDNKEYHESFIKNEINYAYAYAKDVLKGRFELGEPIIASQPLIAYKYAKNIIKGPFPMGEPAIATSAEKSYDYASIVLKEQRFPMGEPAIATNSQASVKYSKYILKSRFPLYEKLAFDKINSAKNTEEESEAVDISFLYYDLKKYVETLVSEPWPAYEEFLEKTDFFDYEDERYEAIADYVINCINGPYPKYEKLIALDAKKSTIYAGKIKDRFKMGEPAIIKDFYDGGEYLLNNYISVLFTIGKVEEFANDYPELLNEEFYLRQRLEEEREKKNAIATEINMLLKVAGEVKAQKNYSSPYGPGYSSPYSDVSTEISSLGPVRNPDADSNQGEPRGWLYQSIEQDLIGEWGSDEGQKPNGMNRVKVEKNCKKCKGKGCSTCHYKGRIREDKMVPKNNPKVDGRIRDQLRYKTEEEGGPYGSHNRDFNNMREEPQTWDQMMNDKMMLGRPSIY